MKFSIIGGGSFGTTLAQVLVDNGHTVMIYDINADFVKKINQENKHPFFDGPLSKEIKATQKLEEVIAFSNYFIIATPAKAIRAILKNINSLLKLPSVFVSVSKGLEPESLFRTSEITETEITPKNLKGFVYLSGPCHAEELFVRKITTMVSFSKDQNLAQEIQVAFSNKYLRIYTSDDVIGAEIAASVKNIIAVASGIAYGYGMGENARAALITRGAVEILQIVKVMGGSKETVYGLAGIGDLIVTCSSFHSRNFVAGKKIGEGESCENVLSNAKMVVEGLRTIEAVHNIGLKYNLRLPLIDGCYRIIKGEQTIGEALNELLMRDLKKE
ncbi:MAG: NAD(P)H-dependent glycerol-3-phosphate dehydrogenase [Erysipelotrichales bacterium]|nr:NAD(P)H-dependent glycerol-3-phosphate dehydrogenase [Erysipelotrichales bacterium]